MTNQQIVNAMLKWRGNVAAAAADLGMRRNSLPLAEFLQRTASSKVLAAQLRPAIEVGDWSSDSPDVFAAPLMVEHDGYVLDVVDVRTSVDSSLARVETLELCRSTPGSFFYDPDSVTDDRSWDDGLDWWDEPAPAALSGDPGDSWDGATPVLYIHQSDGSNPTDGTVAAVLGVHVSSSGFVGPYLGRSLLADPGFEDWDSPTDLAEWTEGTSGCVVEQETNAPLRARDEITTSGLRGDG